jgi:AsmA family protein
MKAFLRNHPVLKWSACAVLGIFIVLAITVTLLDWNSLRGPIARMISAKTGHPTSINGNLSAHLWSWNPTFTAEDLDIRNPEWAARRHLLSVRKITLQISLRHLLLGNLLLPRVELLSPVLDLEREASGRASWDSRSGPPTPANASPHLPAVRQLLIRDGKIHVVDRVRKLSFNGTLVADEKANTKDHSGFQLRCSGSLNDRAFKLQANGGPLINVDPNKPYTFEIHMTAADISLVMQASVPKPFDLAAYEAKFTLSGDDLADAYYLTNLALPNTAKYKFGGTLNHQGNQFRIDDFRGAVGSSDISGAMAVTIAKDRPKLTGHLTSKNLNVADLAPALGSRLPAQPGPPGPSDAVNSGAAPANSGAAPVSAAAAPAMLLPDADLQVNRVRGMDADVTLEAQSVTSPKIPLRSLQFHLVLDRGVLRLDPLSFSLPQGRFAGTVQIDATKTVPESDIDMNLENIDLAQFKPASAKDPPLQGVLTGRAKLHGRGESVHKFASTADGSMSVVIPHGQIRALFAEATGIDVAHSLGLLLTQDRQQTELRCGVAAFQAEQGHLNAKTIVMDTTNVLITGRGSIDLQTERLDLALQGDPKKIRFVRLRAPISVGGSLSKPSVGIKPEKTLLQAGAGIVLAALLTPIAAVLAFVDPGLAKNADCSALMAQAGPISSGAGEP